jgi:hypothetical protein
MEQQRIDPVLLHRLIWSLAMHGIIYLVGLVVIVMAILSFIGLN